MTELQRKCPDCNVVITYSRLDALNIAKKLGRKCKSCCKKGAANPAHNRNMFGENNPFYGKTHTPEVIEKLRKSFTGRKVSDETRKKIGMKSKQIKRTDKWKQNISLSRIGKKHWMYGKHHSKEYKELQSKIAKKRLEKTPPQFIPSFNKTACDLFDELNKHFGWNGQHATNCGEKYVNGYWVDYYEPNLNLVIEYDEAHHFFGGRLKEVDISRQLSIINKLGCKFIRIQEGTSLQEIITLLEVYGYGKSVENS
jgi:hypothetical protein